MAMSRKNTPKTPIINDDPSSNKYAFPPKVRFGMTGRDLRKSPLKLFAPPSDIEIIPDSEIEARIEEQEREQSSLEHIYLRANWEAKDPHGTGFAEQNGDGYCWYYSLINALMLGRERDGKPYKKLSGHAGAAMVKGGRDEGGWCGLSSEHAYENGVGEEGSGPGQWPLHSRNLSNDNAAFRAKMRLYQPTKQFVDLTRPVYSRNLTVPSLRTCMFNNIPCQVDFNHWGHSVCALRWVKIERGSYGLLILNSWLRWGRRGLGILQGSKLIPDGAVAQISSRAA